MKVNGEAIYGTSASPFKRLSWGRCTKKLTPDGATLYLHVFDWPADGKLLVAGLKNAAQRAYLLADPAKKALAHADQRRRADPDRARHARPTRFLRPSCWRSKGRWKSARPALGQDYDGSVVLPAREARLHGSGIQYETGEQRDNLGFWTNPDDWADWELKITRPGRFEVTAEIATLDIGSLSISAGDSTTQGTAYPTGDYGKFRVTKLGTIEIPAAGKDDPCRPVRQGRLASAELESNPPQAGCRSSVKCHPRSEWGAKNTRVTTCTQENQCWSRVCD